MGHNNDIDEVEMNIMIGVVIKKALSDNIFYFKKALEDDGIDFDQIGSLTLETSKYLFKSCQKIAPSEGEFENKNFRVIYQIAVMIMLHSILAEQDTHIQKIMKEKGIDMKTLLREHLIDAAITLKHE